MTLQRPLYSALQGIARGRTVPAPQLVNMEKRQGTQQISDPSQNLTEKELGQLARAVEPRECALTLARQGNIAEARRLLVAAHRIIEEPPLPDEGQTTARSFHLAAEAYVDFVDGRLAESWISLAEALSLCRRLRLLCGHRVEVRRIHLARNMIRLTWSLGSQVEAWGMCGQLLAYVWGKHRPWPLGDSGVVEPAQREKLREDERVFLTDQILSESISVASSSPSSAELPPWPVDAELQSALPESARQVELICRDLSAGHTRVGDPGSGLLRGGGGRAADDLASA